MDILKTLLDAGGGALVQKAGSQVGLDQRQASAAITALLPALAKGMQANIAKPGGLESLIGAVKSGNHQRYVDNPNELGNAVEDGNGILGHLLGSKDVSRQVAAQAGQLTGIDTEKLKSLLPLVATMMMGSVGKKLGDSGSQSPMSGAAAALQSLGSSDAIGGILGQFLGVDSPQQGKGDTAGGLLNLARKFFK